jgi:hypothetical protein
LCFPCGLFPLWFVVWHSTVIENRHYEFQPNIVDKIYIMV